MKSPTHPSGWNFLKGVILTILALLSSGEVSTGTPAFDPPYGIAGPGFALDVDTVDLNGDGNQDLVRAFYDLSSTGGIQILWGRGDGTFDSTIIPSPDRLLSVAIGDLNGDGRLDLVSGGFSGQVYIVLQNPDGSFASGRPYATDGEQCYDVVIGDFNRDLRLDIATMNQRSNDVSVFLGNGDGTFPGIPARYPIGSASVSMIAVDVNNDGSLDLLTGREGPGLGVLFGTPAGTFIPASDVVFPNAGDGLTLADVNSDGRPDVVGANRAGGVTVCLRTATGLLADGVASSPFASAGTGTGVVVADFDGDGRVDALTTHDTIISFGPRVAFHPGLGDGTFGPASTILSRAFGPSDVSWGDFNHDGRPDAALGEDGGVTILRNATPYRVARFTVSTPATAYLAQRFDATVVAYDQFGRRFPEYAGTIEFRTDDKSFCVLLPENYTYVAEDRGEHTFFQALALRTRGLRSITVRDSLDSNATGTAFIDIREVGSTIVTTEDDVVGLDDEISLREAIQNANSHPNVSGVPDAISFNICGDGPHVLRPVSPLPAVSEAAIIDGFTQPGAQENTAVEGNNADYRIILNGDLAGADADGLKLESASTVRGLVIHQFRGNGIATSKAGGATIKGNFIGTNVNGSFVIPNEKNGIALLRGNNVIGGPSPADRNIIAGNLGDGIAMLIDDAANDSNQVIGNYIGTDRTGAAALPNAGNGIGIYGSELAQIGGTGANVRNVISGNLGDGILVTGQLRAARRNAVANNLIGTSANGFGAVPNQGFGIRLFKATENVIGGNKGTDGNLISGNVDGGVFLQEACDRNTIAANRIGTDINGGTALGNGGDGILLRFGCSDNVIGGNAEEHRNIISGNAASGIRITSGSRNRIQNNVIGLKATLAGTVPNGGYGLLLDSMDDFAETSDNLTGGPGPRDPNVIGGNNLAGVFIRTGIGNRLQRNSISGNGGLGIDLDLPGVNPNDAGDPDIGANNRQNYAVIQSVVMVGPSSAQVSGSLNSTPSKPFQIEFFASPEEDPSRYGEGATFLGSASVMTDAIGKAIFSVTLGGVSVDDYLSSTVTSNSNETSEFSFSRRADSDIDGMPDAFELDHGFDPSDPADASEDADGDGQTNLEEFIAGTDPENAASAFRLTESGFRDGVFVVRFSSVVGRRYVVEFTEDLSSGSWTTLALDIPGTGGVVEVPDPGAAGRPARYYRVHATY
jgi:hypothetical protein